MHVADLVRIHEARIAHHVAAIGQIDREHRAAAVANGRRPVVMQRVGDGRKIASGKKRFHALQKRRVDRHRVGKRAVDGAGLFNNDLAVPLDDMRGDFRRVAAHQRFERLLAGEDARAGFAYAHRAQGICRARPAELWLRALVALQQRRRRPGRLKRLALESTIGTLKTGPGYFCGRADEQLNWFPHVHLGREYNTLASACFRHQGAPTPVTTTVRDRSFRVV